MDEGHAAEGGWIGMVAEARVKLPVVVELKMGEVTGVLVEGTVGTVGGDRQGGNWG